MSNTDEERREPTGTYANRETVPNPVAERVPQF